MSNQPPQHDDVVRPIVFPPVLFLVALAAGVCLDLAVALPIFGAGVVRHAVGWPVFVLGAALAVWGQRTMVAADVDPRFKAVGRIVDGGPFRFTRNPLYLSVGLAYVGLACVFDTWWPLTFLPAVFLVLHFGVVLREERYLERRLGDAYRAYRSRVRRWI